MKTSACTTPVGTMSKSVKKEPGWESVRQSRAFCRFSSVSYLGIGALFHSRHGDFKVLRMWSVHSAKTTGSDCFRLGMWCPPENLDTKSQMSNSSLELENGAKILQVSAVSCRVRLFQPIRSRHSSVL